MLFSIGVILLIGVVFGHMCTYLHLPKLIGYLLCGILLGPFGLSLLADSFLSYAYEFRTFALVIILLRAGLSLDVASLKKMGLPAILMCFVPAVFEMVGVVLFAPMILGLSFIDSLLLGSIVAAVSPAVIVPRMLKLIEEGYGQEKKIPHLILAGSSVDDVLVLVLFSSFLSMKQGTSFSFVQMLDIPISILTGILIGCFVAYMLSYIFRKVTLNTYQKIWMVIATALVLMAMENTIRVYISFSGILAVLTMGICLQYQKITIKPIHQELQPPLQSIWAVAEIFLFAVVGASADITSIGNTGFAAIVLLLLCSLFRMLGVYVSLLGTSLNRFERLFCMISYLPKATVQAAIGGVPLSLGLSGGDILLSVAVVAILVTAPIGAWLMDVFYQKLLKKDDNCKILQ